MAIYHYGIEQNSTQWDAMRAGKWCASSAATIMSGETRGTKGIDDLVKTVAWERALGRPHGEERYQSRAMARGHAVEHEARGWAEFVLDADIVPCGFVEHGTIPNVGWSPDGLYQRGRRAVEIKCMLHKAYMDVVDKRAVPPEYRWQVRWAMWVGDLDGLDFIAYHPDAGGIIVPVVRDPECEALMVSRVATLEARVARWNDILNRSGS